MTLDSSAQRSFCSLLPVSFRTFLLKGHHFVSIQCWSLLMIFSLLLLIIVRRFQRLRSFLLCSKALNNKQSLLCRSFSSAELYHGYKLYWYLSWLGFVAYCSHPCSHTFSFDAGVRVPDYSDAPQAKYAWSEVEHKHLYGTNLKYDWAYIDIVESTV